jgi:ubiquinone/menaquinone biosynthesis C-methylase UbiE
MDMSSRFWDKIAPKYARSPIADEAAYQTKLAETRRLFRPDMEVLEFGCGTGSTAVLHAPHVRHITAVDFSRGMLDIAEQRAQAAEVENITFVEADIDGFASSDGAYDMVLTLSFLHLLKDPRAAIERIHRLLKPGGYFVSSTACLGDTPMAALKYVAPLGKALGLLPQLKVFSEDGLVKMIGESGFVVDHRWRPTKAVAAFVIARKPERAA